MDSQSQEAQGRNSATRPRAKKFWIERVLDKLFPGVKYTLLVSLIFYIAMFVIGIWGVHECPVSDHIPFFLIITGGIGLLSKSVTIVRQSIFRDYGVKHVESSIYSVETVFLLLGSYWVFKVYKPSFDYESGPTYCNKTVYMFAFIYLVTIYAFMIPIILCLCCVVCCLCFVRDEINADAEAQTRPLRETNSQNIP